MDYQPSLPGFTIILSLVSVRVKSLCEEINPLKLAMCGCCFSFQDSASCTFVVVVCCCCCCCWWVFFFAVLPIFHFLFTRLLFFLLFLYIRVTSIGKGCIFSVKDLLLSVLPINEMQGIIMRI